MRDLRELNFQPYGEAPLPAPGPGAIAAFERELGVVLPSDFVAMLQFCNGGAVEYNIVDEENFINHFFYFQEIREDDADSVIGATRRRAIEIGGEKVVFGMDSFGNEYFIDCSENPAPVKLWLHEVDDWDYIAPSFGEMIDQLTPLDEAELDG